jgi:hypothetical protein
MSQLLFGSAWKPFCRHFRPAIAREVKHQGGVSSQQKVPPEIA